MRAFNTLEENNIKLLTREGIELAFIMPTATGLEKSIMDATTPLRLFLYQRGIHDYEIQAQGPDHKQIIRSHIVRDYEVISSQASLYRPVTKKGDPRIWFTGLKNHAHPNDILGVFASGGELYVLNLTKSNIEQLMQIGDNSPLTQLIRDMSRDANAISQELLGMIQEIAARGRIPAIGTGDTAIGRTLETLLGIAINSRKAPDYKGIELKSYRDKRGNRKTLFAKVPNWELSKFKSSAEILDHFGYQRGEDFKLYCTLSTLRANSQGLSLRLDENDGHLVEHSENVSIGDFAVWELAALHMELRKKHKETFWVAAEAKVLDGTEHFSFNKVEHTRSPIVSQFDLLLGQGIITLDHLIKRRSNGRVSEKGPLFKIKPDKLDLLFPPSQIYNLNGAV
jgi:hypothetical protein